MNLGQVIEFTVLGIPQPQGSASAFIPKGWKRAVVTSANPKLKKWRKAVSEAAMLAMKGSSPAGKKVPIRLTVGFFFARAKSNRNNEHVIAPDLDKLVRGIGDSLTGVVFDDDSQITEIRAVKSYGEPGVIIRVEEDISPGVSLKRMLIKDLDIPF